MKSNLTSYLFFSYFKGIGPITFNLLLQKLGSVESIYKVSDHELTLLLKESFAQKLIAFRKEFNPEQELYHLQKNNIAVVFFGNFER